MTFEDHSVDPSRPWTKDARRASWAGLDQAHLMSLELIAATLTWAGIGYLTDRALGTGPWLLVVGALLGNAAGIYLVWLRSNRMEGGRDYRPPEAASSKGALAGKGAADDRS